MQGKFGEAIAHIHDTGKLWRSSWEFRQIHNRKAFEMGGKIATSLCSLPHPLLEDFLAFHFSF